MQQAMGQIGPLLLGLQTGQLAGQLATESVARYYYPIPRDDSGGLFFVLGNITKVANDYGFEESAFRSWLAAQEVSRHLVMTSVGWTGRYFRNLLEALVDSIEIDIADLERRLMELQSSGFEALQEGPPDAIPVVKTEQHSRALGRVRAFLALLEGYGTHASNSVLPQLVGDGAGKIGEGMARLRASPSDGQTMLASLLGISFDRALETSGATFCAAVVKLRGLAALNRVWDAPDNLPSSDEIKDPFAWMERVLDE
jgi:putative hydrolase